MRLVPLLIALAAVPARALDGEAGFTYENLDKGKPDWKSAYLEAAHDFAPRQTLYGMVRETERFDSRDTELMAGYYQPLGQSFTGLLEASASPQHNVLPASSVFGQLAWIAGGGWVASGGLRYSDYTDTHTRLLTASLERYFETFRAFVALHNGKPAGAGSATSGRVGIDAYYCGERCRIGVAATWGREVENVGPPAGIITSDVRAFGLYGRHEFAPAWALTWDLGTHEQGDLYRRTGGRLGLRHRF